MSMMASARLALVSSWNKLLTSSSGPSVLALGSWGSSTTCGSWGSSTSSRRSGHLVQSEWELVILSKLEVPTLVVAELSSGQRSEGQRLGLLSGGSGGRGFNVCVAPSLQNQSVRNFGGGCY